ncbi:MAG: DUF6438 domain-containing protein, partial [Maribacter sp.]
MKNVMILLILALASCKSSDKVASVTEKKAAILQYSKGPCLGRCPVYNFQIFDDGMVVYQS